MPAHRLSMHKIKDVLRMHFKLKLSHRQIVRALSVSRAGVRVSIERARAAGLSWPLPEAMTDADLESRLYPPDNSGIVRPRRPLPDWDNVRSELSCKHVTRRLVWEEYREAQSAS